MPGPGRVSKLTIVNTTGRMLEIIANYELVREHLRMTIRDV